MVGITGQSEQSTLINLILGLLNPTRKDYLRQKKIT